MRYETIIFDLDGTLLNTLEDLMNSVNYAMDAHNFPKRSIEEIRTFVGNGNRRLINLSVPADTSEEIKNDCFDLFMKHYLKHSQDKTMPYSGIPDMIENIKTLGIKTAVVTNKVQVAAVSVVRHYFGDCFDCVIGQIDGMAQKPAPDGVLLAMKNLGADPDKTVYIGDSEVDCMTAHNSGLPIIGCSWGFRGKDILKEHSSEYIIDNPDEIINIIKG